MKNIMLIIEYDGSCYHGWQIQPRMTTVQGVITAAIKKITGEDITLTASGRTDAGVHALAQTANFFTSSTILPESIKKGLNSILPPDITITEASLASSNFNARFCAKKKHYRYIILNRPYRSSFGYRYEWLIPYKLDIWAMKKCAPFFVGEKDFTSFCSSTSDSVTKVRRIFDLTIEKKGSYIEFNITGSGFLKYMVRTIVGTIVEVGRGKIEYPHIKNILRSKDRRNAGPTAPAAGLFLVRVEYDKEAMGTLQ